MAEESFCSRHGQISFRQLYHWLLLPDRMQEDFRLKFQRACQTSIAYESLLSPSHFDNEPKALYLNILFTLHTCRLPFPSHAHILLL